MKQHRGQKNCDRADCPLMLGHHFPAVDAGALGDKPTVRLVTIPAHQDRDQAAPSEEDSPPELRLISRPAVCRIVGLSPATIHRLVARGQFPAQISLGSRMARWIEGEVIQWVRDRAAQRGKVVRS